MNTSKAIFRCDAAVQIGSGHVVRCMVLADALKNAGWHCIFAVSEETRAFMPALAGWETIGADAYFAGDLLVVDHYGLDAAYETAMRPRVKKIAVIDDLADRMHDCDLLMDQTLGRGISDYKTLTPPHCKILTGAKYALLRPQFAERRTSSLARRSGFVTLYNVFLSFGATNPDSLTERVLEDLESFEEKQLEITIVMGGRAQGLENVRAKAKAMNHHKARLLTDVQEMAAEMEKADLVIGAGGTSSWERCCLGLPALLIEIADNQSMISQGLARAGAVKYLGRIESLQPGDVAKELKKMHKDTAILRQMSVAAAAVCDGNGTARVVESIANVLG
jgi:UDP-2,4-diacetamido-2,4,6-trideoxy-beta-L-altropyranose hydrolase